MVHVNNIENSPERSSVTGGSDQSSALQSQAQTLMRETPLNSASSGKATEPNHIDFTNPYTHCTEKPAATPRAMTQVEKDFKPDLSYSSKGSQEWLDKAKRQNAKPIELDSAGKYDVKPGDTLTSIATRLSRTPDHNPSQAEIQQKVKDLQSLNADQFGNRDLIKPGMSLIVTPPKELDQCKAVAGALPNGGSDIPPGGGAGASAGAAGIGNDSSYSASHATGSGGDGSGQSSGSSFGIAEGINLPNLFGSDPGTIMNAPSMLNDISKGATLIPISATATFGLSDK